MDKINIENYIKKKKHKTFRCLLTNLNINNTSFIKYFLKTNLHKL